MELRENGSCFRAYRVHTSIMDGSLSGSRENNESTFSRGCRKDKIPDWERR